MCIVLFPNQKKWIESHTLCVDVCLYIQCNMAVFKDTCRGFILTIKEFAGVDCVLIVVYCYWVNKALLP